MVYYQESSCQMCESPDEVLYKVGELFICKNCRHNFSAEKTKKDIKKFRDKNEK